MTDQAFVPDNTQRVHIGGRGCRLTGCLFGCQILGCTHHLTGSGQRNLVRKPSNTEVGNLHPVIRGDHQVTGLHIAVHEALSVRSSQRASRLRNKVQDAIRRQRAVALDDARQRLTRNQLHHQVCRVILFTVIEHIGNTGVVQERSMARLRTETLQEPGVTRILLFQDFNGDGASENLVASFPDLTHTADSDTFG